MSDNNVTTSTINQPHADDVGRLARGTFKWIFSLLIIKQVFVILTTMIVSRHVSPEETGTVGMVLTFVSFLVLFDTGLTWATVQPKHITSEQIDSMFWFGLLLGVLLWVICVIAGPFLAEFYQTPKLIMISVVVGLSPLFNSLTTQFSALLKRTMQQKKDNTIDGVAVLISSLIGIFMALTHMGCWAIVWQLVSMQIFRFILLFVFSDYKPKSPTFSRSAYVLLRSGWILALSNFICYFQLYLGTILIGHLFGNAALGFYLKATGLKGLPTTYATMLTTDVMVTSLAAFHDNRQRLGDAYRKALMLIAFVGCPMAAMFYPMASETVRFFYGTQWSAAVPLLKIMTASAIVLPITTTTIWLFLAAGKAGTQLIMNVYLTILTLLIYYIASRYAHSLEGIVIYEALLFTLILPIVNIVVSHRVVGIRIMETVKIVFPILICSVLTSLVVEGLSKYVDLIDFTWLVVMLIKAMIGLFFYIALTMFVLRPFPIPVIMIALQRVLKFFEYKISPTLRS